MSESEKTKSSKTGMLSTYSKARIDATKKEILANIGTPLH